MESKVAELTKYLEGKGFNFLEPMIADVLKNKPTNPSAYCLQWLLKYQKNKKQENVSEDQEDDIMTQEQLFQKKKKIMGSNKKQSRIAISEEVFGTYNKKTDFVPKVVQKSEQSELLILSLLRNSILFNNVDKENEKIIISAMEEINCQQGETIINEGEAADCLYIVESGQYNCYKNINGTETYLKTYYYGQFFGELALMYNAPRAATIKVKKAGKLFKLDRMTFSEVAKGSSMKKRKLLQQTLSKIDLFADIQNYQRQQLFDAMRQQKAQEGEYIIKQGQNGDKFYIVLEGKLVAQKMLPGLNSLQIVYHYKQGDYFGELSLLHDINRQASVKSLTPVKLVSINRDTFMRMLGPIKNILNRNEEKYKQIEAQLAC